ncbi:hypothetical protein ABXV24_05510 [Vibrio owensii]|uniref:hypothetical protein n=1 Tax=Vibrio owensii TaxID=696485 RepID=UPI003391D82B
MMKIEIAPWYNNFVCPVLFMVDELANIAFDAPGGDWGYYCFDSGSIYEHLNKNVLNSFPHVKFTFFLVTGEREVQSSGQYDHVHDCTFGEFPEFLKSLKFLGHDIGYHGLTHGVVQRDKFIQEWDSFSSLEEANISINTGLGLFERGVGVRASGGKYCGYKKGDYGHESLVSNKFDWWFSDWNDDVSENMYGEFHDDILYLPSNIDCSMYSCRSTRNMFSKKYFTSIYKQLRTETLEYKLRFLLENGGIISLQEHTSPIRTDSITQYPNVINDISNIKYILDIIVKYDVWWCTASELTQYIRCKNSVSIVSDGVLFSFLSENEDVSFTEGSFVSLLFDINVVVSLGDESYFSVKIDEIFVVNVPVYLTKTYHIGVV